MASNYLLGFMVFPTSFIIFASESVDYKEDALPPLQQPIHLRNSAKSPNI